VEGFTQLFFAPGPRRMTAFRSGSRPGSSSRCGRPFPRSLLTMRRRSCAPEGRDGAVCCRLIISESPLTHGRVEIIKS
jgi:hypothetical protein